MRRLLNNDPREIQLVADDLDRRLRRIEYDSDEISSLHAAWEELTEPGWTDMVVSSANVRLPASAAPTNNAWKTSLLGLDFAPTGGEYVHIEGLQFPHGYEKGTDILWHVHFAPRADMADGLTVTWQLIYTVSSPFRIMPATVTVTSTFTNNAASRAKLTASELSGTTILADTHLISESATCSGTGLDFSSVLSGRIERLAADTYGSNAIFLSSDFHYRANRFGTRSEYSD